MGCASDRRTRVSTCAQRPKRRPGRPTRGRSGLPVPKARFRICADNVDPAPETAAVEKASARDVVGRGDKEERVPAVPRRQGCDSLCLAASPKELGPKAHNLKAGISRTEPVRSRPVRVASLRDHENAPEPLPHQPQSFPPPFAMQSGPEDHYGVCASWLIGVWAHEQDHGGDRERKRDDGGCRESEPEAATPSSGRSARTDPRPARC